MQIVRSSSKARPKCQSEFVCSRIQTLLTTPFAAIKHFRIADTLNDVGINSNVSSNYTLGVLPRAETVATVRVKPGKWANRPRQRVAETPLMRLQQKTAKFDRRLLRLTCSHGACIFLKEFPEGLFGISHQLHVKLSADVNDRSIEKQRVRRRDT